MWSLHARGHFRVFTIAQHTNPAERSFTLYSHQLRRRDDEAAVRTSPLGTQPCTRPDSLVSLES
jgi:hypothetical protein